MKQASPEEDPTAVVDAEWGNWTCTPEGDVKFLFCKGTIAPIVKPFLSFVHFPGGSCLSKFFLLWRREGATQSPISE